MDKVEFLILKNLLFNEEYARKVIPFIKLDYFEDHSHKILFEEISNFIVKYDELPTKESISIDIQNRVDLNGGNQENVIMRGIQNMGFVSLNRLGFCLF